MSLPLNLLAIWGAQLPSHRLLLAIAVWLVSPLALAALVRIAAAAPPPAHAIQVVDSATGRGVPLVELKTVADVVYMTDSNGYVAIDDPTLLGRRVFFFVSSHGYEFAKDGFGFRGRALKLDEGGRSELRIKRLNVAERLYRITGAGVYRDTIKLGKEAPVRRPLMNAFVTGQDSVQAVVKGKQIYWLWGDTDRIGYPLGQFNTSGAVSRLPSSGGVDPARGVDLEYFVDPKSGFSRPMFERENGVLIWVHGAFLAPGENGKPSIFAHWSRWKNLGARLSHGIALFRESSDRFEMIREFDKDEPLYPRGHGFELTDQGTKYICFADPYAIVRVPARYESIVDPDQYQSYSPLRTGSGTVEEKALDRDADGRVRFAWRTNTAPVEPKRLRQWVAEGVLKARDNRLRTLDAASGEPILLQRGSMQWNAHRQRWIMIANQVGGSPSFLGEIWYSEAKRPEGPFARAVKIVSHNGYSFYNVTHHPFFDQEGGRRIYLEGTYTSTFSKSKTKTPWYDYNQIMYGLDLTDPRLKAAFVD